MARSNHVSCDGNRILPAGGCFSSEDPKGRPRDEMSLMVEGVVNGGIDIQKTLRGSRRLESLHLAFSSPHDLMGVFSAIVLSEASIVRASEAQLPESRAVRAQLVCDQQLRCEACFLSSCASAGVPPAYRAGAERACRGFALMVDGAPPVHPPPSDPNDHLVEVPSRAGACAALPQLARDQRAEFQHPAPHRLI